MPYEAIIATYLMSNKRHGTLYVGVTNDLVRRSHEHKYGLYEGFSKRYNLHILVYFETHSSMDEAMHREKRLKKYTREQKIRLIENMNPDWLDLYNTLQYRKEIAL